MGPKRLATWGSLAFVWQSRSYNEGGQSLLRFLPHESEAPLRRQLLDLTWCGTEIPKTLLGDRSERNAYVPVPYTEGVAVCNWSEGPFIEVGWIVTKLCSKIPFQGVGIPGNGTQSTCKRLVVATRIQIVVVTHPTGMLSCCRLIINSSDRRKWI